MKYPRVFIKAALILAGALAAAPAAPALVITQWNFSGAAGAGDNSPAPTTGTGTATMLGMTNSYNYTIGATNATIAGVGATASGDVLSSPGVANTSFNEFTWRIRGIKGSGDTGSANNGWNISAPQYSQGAEFDVSTAGYSNISFSFDWYSTNQGVRDLQEQYTLDGTTWNNIGPVLAAVPNDYFGTSSPTNTISFSSIVGASNDPDFGVRLVSAYDPTYTGTGSPSYTSATLTGGLPTQYNNNSGNWRFANITVEGTAVAVPEPGTTAMLTGVVALVAGGIYRRRRS